MLNACCVTKGAVPNFFLKKPWSLFQGSLACSIAHFVQYGWKCLVLFLNYDLIFYALQKSGRLVAQ